MSFGTVVNRSQVTHDIFKIIIIIIIIAYSYSASFICVPRHNAQKRFIVFTMDWWRKYTYKLSKCFVEQGSFKSGGP